MSIENVTGLPITTEKQTVKLPNTNPPENTASLGKEHDLSNVSAESSKLVDKTAEKEVAKNADSARQQEVHKAVDRLKEHVQNLDREFQFNVDKETGDIVVKVVNPENNQVVRQIPSEELLKLVQRLEENKGSLLRETA